MWYFTWVLGLGFACAFGILHAMWIEFRESNKLKKNSKFFPESPPVPANEGAKNSA